MYSKCLATLFCHYWAPPCTGLGTPDSVWAICSDLNRIPSILPFVITEHSLLLLILATANQIRAMYRVFSGAWGLLSTPVLLDQSHVQSIFLSLRTLINPCTTGSEPCTEYSPEPEDSYQPLYYWIRGMYTIFSWAWGLLSTPVFPSIPHLPTSYLEKIDRKIVKFSCLTLNPFICQRKIQIMLKK